MSLRYASLGQCYTSLKASSLRLFRLLAGDSFDLTNTIRQIRRILVRRVVILIVTYAVKSEVNNGSFVNDMKACKSALLRPY